VTPGREFEDLLRESAPQVLAALVRRHGRFDECEDAVQEALLAAARQWPTQGVPKNPRAWLVTVAGRALVDQWRSDSARRRREVTAAQASAGADAGAEDTLSLLFLCCHPVLAPESQLALTLRALGGLTTSQIAAALLVPEATVAKRITRAKSRVRDAGARLEPVAEPMRAERLAVARHVLYLIFNEGYTASDGPALQRPDLTREAIRLTRMLRHLVPADVETAGLLALMLSTDARRDARTDADGRLIPLADQDRSRWDQALIAEAQALLHRTLGAGPIGQFQVQAAIAALHNEAPTAESTDWPQILALYDVLATVAPGPLVVLSRAVAVAMVHGPKAGLAILGTLEDGDRHGCRHRLEAVRAHLLEQSGDTAAARDAYLAAARLAASAPEQRYLQIQAARLGGPR
jgi:RNA polymerase sigma factor (sigma-70 family)